MIDSKLNILSSGFMKILFFIYSLKIGGSEKSISNIANFLSNIINYNVTIVTQFPRSYDYYPLNNNIIRQTLNSYKSSSNIFQSLLLNIILLLKIRLFIQNMQPDIIISFLPQMNIRVLIASTFLNLPIIISERTNIRMHEMKLIWSFLRRIIYPTASALVVQTICIKSMSYKFNRNVMVIPNFVEPHTTNKSIPNTHIFKFKKYILAVGCLSKEKQFDILLKIFRLVRNEIPDWGLVIAGDGIEYAYLKKTIAAFNLVDFVFMPGTVNDPFQIFNKAEIFVLTSAYEAFPNVLLEAMSSGIAPVCFNCVSGPAELIENRKSGFLIDQNDIFEFKRILCELINDENMRKNIGNAATYVNNKYTKKIIMEKWFSLFNNLTTGLGKNEISIS